VGEVGSCEVFGAFVDEILDFSSIGTGHCGREFYTVEGASDAYARGHDVVSVGISLAVSDEAGIVDDSGVTTEMALAFGGDGLKVSRSGGSGRGRRSRLQVVVTVVARWR